MNDQSHATEVSVALALFRGETTGACPDEEELAALYEDRLPPARRYEVLSHLANDASVYAQWLAFFEHAEELGLSAQPAIEMEQRVAEPPAGQRNSTPSLLDRIKGLSGLFILVPGTALAGLAAFLLFFPAPQPMGLDQLYSQYGQSVSSRLELPTRSLGNFWAEPEPERYLLSQGFKVGLDRLNVDSSELELLAEKLEQPETGMLSDDLAQTLQAIGQWAAIVQVRCPAPGTEFVTAADQVWSALQVKLETMDLPYVQTLMESLRASSQSESESAGRLCRVASVIATEV